MSHGVIIVSRDRPELALRTVASWVAQELPVTVLTEPDQAGMYRETLAGFADVRAHPEADMGVGYARHRSVLHAAELGYTSYIMGDDDTVAQDPVTPMLRFADRGVAVNVGGYMSVHRVWFPPELRDMTGHVVQHFSDKLFATNVKLALEVGNYDPTLQIEDTSDWNRQCIAAGYLWWVHVGVRVKEIGRTDAPGGIRAFAEGRGGARKDLVPDMHRHVLGKWGSEYVSQLSSAKYRANSARLIRDRMGPEAYRAYKEKVAFPDDSPDIPHGVIARPEQMGLGV